MSTPPVRRRLLGTALRDYRESLGYDLGVAARILDCDRSKISRIETGQRGIRAKELRELLTEYGVPDTEQEALLAIAHRGRESGWWLDYRDVLTEAAQDYIVLELAATEILGYDPDQVPDLLQTPEYARAVADADPSCTAEEQRAHAVEVKLNRQRIVVRERAPRLEFVITEGVLRQTVGAPRVMRAQLDRLASLAETGFAAGLPDGGDSEGGGRPGAPVSLLVLPFAAGAAAVAGRGAMSVLRFAGTQGIGVVHLPALSGGVGLDGQEEVVRYLRAFAQLRAAALSPARSARLIRGVARSYDR
jgi:transcriptional regulator with XRE-family HTH domain